MELDLSLIGRDRFLDKKQPRIFLTKKFNQTAKGKNVNSLILKPKKKRRRLGNDF